MGILFCFGSGFACMFDDYLWKSFFFLMSSLHLSFMHGCLGNIQWRVGLQPGLLLASNSSSLECFMYIYIYIYISISLSSHHSLSFFNPHFEISSSLFLFCLWRIFRSSPVQSTPVRASMVVRGRAFLFVVFVSKFFFSRFDLNAMAEKISWRRGSISHPSERTSYVLPQDHDVLAINFK